MSLPNQGAYNAAIKSVCDILRRSNCTSAMQYVPELTWLLFLRVLDEREEGEAKKARAVGERFRRALSAPYRWQDWAAPGGAKRKELVEGPSEAFRSFVNGELIPHLKGLRDRPGATARQKVIAEILSDIESTRVDTEKNLLDTLDKIHEITLGRVDTQHIFPLSQAYEGLLLKMGEKKSDGGQYFTPREVIRAVVRAVDPKPGETVYDPCCGTGGFLIEAYEHVLKQVKRKRSTWKDIRQLGRHSLFGREKENLIYPIALANLVLHGVDYPHLWHGNALDGNEFYGGLYESAPETFDVVLSNPPFGGREGKGAQARFAYKSGSTQILFLQDFIDVLRPGGRCGCVVDPGVLFRTKEKAFRKTKEKLLRECDLWAIVCLPPKVFMSAGTSIKTNLLFFTKGKPTKKVWYYEFPDDLKVSKTKPLTLKHFEEFFKLLPKRGDSERSWTVSIEEIKERGYDLRAVNPNANEVLDARTPGEITAEIRGHMESLEDALRRLEK